MKSRSLGRIATGVGALGSIIVSAAPTQAAFFETSFESPTYAAGNLVTQDGWTTDAITPDSGRQVVVGGTGGLPAAPSGSQMAMIASPGSNERAQHSLGATPITEDFIVDITMAHRGITAGGDGAYIYINTPGSAFNGVIFGFADGFLKYRSGNTWVSIDADPDTGAIDAPAADTFYRFVATVHPSVAKYDLAVFDADNVQIGNFTGLASRNGLAEFSQIRLFTLNAGDVLLADSISVSAVPEPASMAMFALAGLFLASYRR